MRHAQAGDYLCHRSCLDMNLGTVAIPSMEGGFLRKNRKSTTIPMTDRVKGFLQARAWDGPYLLRPDIAAASWRYRYDFRKSLTSKCADRDWSCNHARHASFVRIKPGQRWRLHRKGRQTGSETRSKLLGRITRASSAVGSDVNRGAA